MSALIPSAAPQVSTPASRGDGHDTGFFAYHGAWAPGVRLFRKLRFASKALIISLAFLLPLLALLSWQLEEHAEKAMDFGMQMSTAAQLAQRFPQVGAALRERFAPELERYCAQLAA